MQANSSEAIKVDVAVVDQYLTESAAKLKGVFPNWIDVTAFSSFMSTYVFWVQRAYYLSSSKFFWGVGGYGSYVILSLVYCFI